MSLHKEFYDLRERVWAELEKKVHEGYECLGKFPIIVGELHSKTTNTVFADVKDIQITGFVKDENYYIHPPKKSEQDINVITNKIKVKLWQSYPTCGIVIEEVTPYLSDLQSLATYLSGGYSLYV